jgi:hypothetical protein
MRGRGDSVWAAVERMKMTGNGAARNEEKNLMRGESGGLLAG